MILIEIKPVDLVNEKITEPITSQIELAENYLLYSAEYYGQIPKDVEDKQLGWEDYYQNFNIKKLRSTICSLEKRWVVEGAIWMVEIEAYGYPNSIHFQFQTEKEADVVYNELDFYIFGPKERKQL